MRNDGEFAIVRILRCIVNSRLSFHPNPLLSVFRSLLRTCLDEVNVPYPEYLSLPSTGGAQTRRHIVKIICRSIMLTRKV